MSSTKPSEKNKEPVLEQNKKQARSFKLDKNTHEGVQRRTKEQIEKLKADLEKQRDLILHSNERG